MKDSQRAEQRSSSRIAKIKSSGELSTPVYQVAKAKDALKQATLSRACSKSKKVSKQPQKAQRKKYERVDISRK